MEVLVIDTIFLFSKYKAKTDHKGIQIVSWFKRILRCVMYYCLLD